MASCGWEHRVVGLACQGWLGAAPTRFSRAQLVCYAPCPQSCFGPHMLSLNVRNVSDVFIGNDNGRDCGCRHWVALGRCTHGRRAHRGCAAAAAAPVCSRRRLRLPHQRMLQAAERSVMAVPAVTTSSQAQSRGRRRTAAASQHTHRKTGRRRKRQTFCGRAYQGAAQETAAWAASSRRSRA